MNNAEHRWIKYYRDGVSPYFEFEEAKPILDSFDVSRSYSVNQIIEFDNIKNIVGSIPCALQYKTIAQSLGKFVYRFFSQIKENDVEELFSSVDPDYSLDVLKLFERYKKIQVVRNELFLKLLKGGHIRLYEVLKCSRWVSRFCAEIKECMLTQNDAAEILIRYYLEKDFRKSEGIHLPLILTLEDKIQILGRYADISSNPNPNYLKLIAEAPHIKELPISDELKLKAIDAQNSFWRKNAHGLTIVPLKPRVNFLDVECEKEKKFDERARSECYIYSKKWVADHRDFPTLLNNFIYLFDFVDSELRSTFVSKKSSLKHEAFFGRDNGIGHYNAGLQFHIDQSSSLHKLDAYIKELALYDIEIEDLISFFFNEYLKKEFNVEGFDFVKPSKGVTLQEKIIFLLPKIDGLLKQFALFLKNEKIDRRLFAMSSKSYRFGEIGSFQKYKYAYACGDEIKREMSLLFSHRLLMGSNFDLDQFDNLEALLIVQNIRMEDFNKFVYEQIEWLIKRGSLVKRNGLLKLNKTRCNLLYNLYENEVVCFAYRTKPEKDILLRLEKNNEIEVEGKLFSRLERDYLNFMLNKKEFSNGFDMRNIPLHGAFDENIFDACKFYLEILKILILIVIKINEEFCLRANSV